MQDSRPRAHTRDRIFVWTTRLALLTLVVAAPWPFGSVTSRPAAALAVAAVVIACGLFVERLYSRRLAPTPARAWILGAFALGALQLVPLPILWTKLLAPAVFDVYQPLHESFGGDGFARLSIEPFQTQWSLLQLAGFAAAFWVASQLFRHGRERRLVGYVLAGLGVTLALFAVYQKARYGGVLYGRYPVPSATPFGPFVNHNHFAGFVEACGLVGLGLALGTAARSASLAVLLGGASAIMGISILLSHSRGGLLAAAVGILVLSALSGLRAGLREGRRRRLGAVIAGIAGILLFLVAFAPPAVFDRFSTLSDPTADGSVQFRLKLWSDSLALAGRSPLLGTGLGTYAAVIPRYREGPDETRAEFAESDWLQFLCESGALGLTLAFGFLYSVGRRAIENLERERSPESRGITLGALAGATALVVHGLYDFNLHIPSNALLFAVLLGVAARHGEPLGRGAARAPARTVIGATAAALLALVFAITTLKVAESRSLTERVDPLLTEPGELSDLIRDLSRSKKRMPANPETAFLLGRLYNEEAYRARDAARYRDVRLGQAVGAFREALRLAPARGRYWFELAWSEANRGNDGIAERLFARAIELEPHLSALRANYASFLASRGRVDEALDQLAEARQLEPGLSPLEALHVLAPYVGEDGELLRRAAGSGADAERALLQFKKSR